MTSKRICPRHERAYPANGACDWCDEPAPAASTTPPAEPRDASEEAIYEYLATTWGMQ